MISITVDRDEDWINKSTVHNFDEARTPVIFVPITKFPTLECINDTVLGNSNNDKEKSHRNNATAIA